jgi:lipopolysaccharide export system protein LptA
MKIIFRTTLLIPSVFIIALTLFLSSNAGAEDDSSEPIHIEADRMISQEQQNSVVFLGNVVAKQGDLVIRTDEMTVFYVPEDDGAGKKNSSKVKKMICKGNVEITQDDWVGTGKRMDYYAQDRKVILSEDAKGWQGENMVSGKTITYYLDEGRSIVEAATTDSSTGSKEDGEKPGRVKAVIHPGSDSK